MHRRIGDDTTQECIGVVIVYRAQYVWIIGECKVRMGGWVGGLVSGGGGMVGGWVGGWKATCNNICA